MKSSVIVSQKILATGKIEGKTTIFHAFGKIQIQQNSRQLTVSNSFARHFWNSYK
jgi:hypothetical protein